MAQAGEEGIGSMGNDSPLAVLSNKNKPLYNYFKQLFAQVTNPPIDPIREAIVMSLVSFIGPKPNLLDINDGQPADAARSVAADARLRRHGEAARHRAAHRRQVQDATSSTSPTRSPGARKASRRKLASLCAEAVDAIKRGHNILIITDRTIDREQVAIPALLALSAIHQHLVREGLRTTAGLVVETGSAREVHHFALLAGYGAEAVHPVPRAGDAGRAARRPAGRAVGRQGDLQLHQGDRQGPVEDHVEDGHLDLHVATAARRCSRPSAWRRRWSTSTSRGTASQVDGIGVFEVAEEAIRMHRAAFGDDPVLAEHARRRRRIRLARARRRAHVDARRDRQAAARRARQQLRAPTRNTRSSSTTSRKRHMTLRGLFEFKRRSGEGDSDRRSRAGRPRSSSASPPARCRSARSRPKRTPRSPSR